MANAFRIDKVLCLATCCWLYEIADSTNLLCKSVCRCSVFLFTNASFFWSFLHRHTHRPNVSFSSYVRFMAIAARRNVQPKNGNEESILFAFSALRCIEQQYRKRNNEIYVHCTTKWPLHSTIQWNVPSARTHATPIGVSLARFLFHM